MDIDSKNKSDNKAKSVEKVNFFANLFSSLFKSSNPEAEKKRKLRNISKALSKSKYHAYYKPSSNEVMPPFAKLLYDIYKVISPAQVFFKSAPNPDLLKRRLIDYSLSEHQVELLEILDEQKIFELARKTPYTQLEKNIEEQLQIFLNEFDGERINKAENLNKAFTLFKDFCEFDYYVLLRKFDSSIQEFQFNGTPHFEKIADNYVMEDIKDFIDVAYAITDETVVWEDLFAMFKETQGKEFVAAGVWRKIVAKVRSIQVSQTFEMMIQLSSQDPNYQTQLKYSYNSLIEPYIEKIQNEVRQALSKVSHQQKEDKTNSICIQIFGTATPNSLSSYVPGFNAVLEKKDLSRLEYTEPLNYLKTFILEHVKREIREYYDVVVIRGQWDATLSAPMSNAYQELIKASDDITKFDEDFSEEGQIGMKIKTLLPKTAHDHGAENIINRVIYDCNETAKDFILSSTQNLIVIGKTLKQLIEDYSLQKPVIVANWRELEKYIETPMKEFSIGIYKKIYLFVQLMQQYIGQ